MATLKKTEYNCFYHKQVPNIFSIRKFFWKSTFSETTGKTVLGGRQDRFGGRLGSLRDKLNLTSFIVEEVLSIFFSLGYFFFFFLEKKQYFYRKPWKTILKGAATFYRNETYDNKNEFFFLRKNDVLNDVLKFFLSNNMVFSKINARKPVWGANLRHYPRFYWTYFSKHYKGASTSVCECEQGMQDWGECEWMPKSCLFSIHHTSKQASVPLVIYRLPEWVYVQISMIENVFFFEVPTPDG